MKRFGTIYKFELKGHLKSKTFLVITLLLVVLIAGILSFPRIKKMFTDGSDTQSEMSEKDNSSVMILGGDTATANAAKPVFDERFPDYTVKISDKSEEEIRSQILSEEAECAFILADDGSYKYLVNNLELYDMNTETADAILTSVYRSQAMISEGLSEEQVKSIMSIGIEHTVETIGNDQTNSFFYTYIMIFTLYMVILLYGQMVSTSVATEKSSRAMELLVTSVDPRSMLFGKVLAACTAGLTQLVAIFGSALIFFRLNKSYWDKNKIVTSIFNIPTDMFIYMIIFFLLGFVLYAFMLGAVGSTVSKLEELNTASMPVTLLFVVGFVIVIMSMSGAGMDNTLIKVCSFIPFTSPMAMFSRIAMSNVPFYQIIISIVILIASVFGIGILSARIYRTGVLLYGTAPKLSNIIKLNFQKKK